MNMPTQNNDSGASKEERRRALLKKYADRYKDKVDEIQRNMKAEVDANLASLDDSKNEFKNMQDMIKKMRTMQSDLDAKFESMKKEALLHNLDIDKLIDSVDSITGKEKEIIRNMEDALKKKIENAIPPESCLKPLPKTKEQLTKERLGKTRGARNKWLPMH